MKIKTAQTSPQVSIQKGDPKGAMLSFVLDYFIGKRRETSTLRGLHESPIQKT